jgi:hypothetical protein
VVLYHNLLNEFFSHIFGQSYFFEISTGSERPATTTAKRLAKLDDVAFVG